MPLLLDKPMENRDIRFFNPRSEIDKTKNRLPHWQQDGACYFVTWRLADSIPKEKLDQHYHEKERWLRSHPKPWDSETESEFHRCFSGQLDRWMDAGHGACLLNKEPNAALVEEALHFFEGERTNMLSFVVMPNHVHALFVLNPDWKLESMIKSWKGASARSINRLEHRTGEPLWQKDYFDRIVRDQKHYRNCVRYIRGNPEKAQLRAGAYRLWESALAYSVV